MPTTAMEKALIEIRYDGPNPVTGSIEADETLEQKDLFPILRRTPKDSAVTVAIAVPDNFPEEVKDHILTTSQGAVSHLCGRGSEVFIA